MDNRIILTQHMFRCAMVVYVHVAIFTYRYGPTMRVLQILYGINLIEKYLNFNIMDIAAGNKLCELKMKVMIMYV